MYTKPDPEQEDQSIGELLQAVIGTLKRRRHWFLLCGTAIPLIAATVVMMLPDKYESSATLVVLQPRISQRFVEPSAPVLPTDAFLAVNREILSRSQLIAIIQDYSLYPQLRSKNASPERLAAQMRKDIRVEGQDWTKTGEIVSFQMAYSADTPELAQKVTARLASLFIEENLRKRNLQTETTTRFLTEQIENARNRMAEQEQKVRDYKVKNLEQLPQQQQALMSSLTDSRIRLQAVSASLVRAEQQRSSLKSLLANQLGRLQEERQALLQKYTDKHQAVIKKQQDIERIQALSARLSSEGATPQLEAKELGSDDAQVAQLRAQVEESLSEIANLRRDQNTLNAEITRNQSLLRLTPVREQELTDILRDYDLYRKDYAELLDKKLNADLSANMEGRNEGQQFRLVDPPALPDRPSGPPRLKISLAALAGGILGGLVLAFVIDSRKNAFYSEKDLRRTYEVPIVSAVPSLLTSDEERKRKWRIAGEWAITFCLVLLVAAAQLYVYRNG
jgi:polysaccharide chain length determinant protein (PEP-CTERM system associated)